VDKFSEDQLEMEQDFVALHWPDVVTPAPGGAAAARFAWE
jgi:hypothetical protein